MTQWFRFYGDAINDPKVLKLPEVTRWRWVAVLSAASKHHGRIPNHDDLALMLRITAADAKSLLSTLEKANLIDRDTEGFTPHNWNKFQYKSDEAKDPKGKGSYVYIIGHQWGSEVLKIGFSKNPWARVGELQTAHHEKLSVLAVFKCQSHSEVDLHDLLKVHRKAGEWFALPTQICVAIRNAYDRSASYDNIVAELRGLLRSTTTETRSATTETETETDTEAETEQKNGRVGSAREAEEAYLLALGQSAGPRAPEKKRLISEEAFALAPEILRMIGVEDGHPLSMGAPYSIQTWINGGWPVEAILAGIQRAMANKQGDPPSTLKYFEKAIARVHAEMTRELPVVKLVPQVTEIHNGKTQRPGGSLIASIDRALAQSIEEDRRAAMHEDPVLSLPARPVH